MSAALAPGAPARVWSPMQEAIFSAVASPGGHLVIEALAGTGKSTTIEEAVARTPASASCVVLAFNKAIADALRVRLPTDVECRTFNSLGNGAVRQAMGHRELDTHRDFENAWLKDLVGASWSDREARTCCKRLISIAKATLASDYEALDAAADAYGIEFPKGYGRAALLRAALRCVERSAQACKGPITFDDQVWLPVALELPLPTYDYVFVDETQDLNATQLALAQRLASEGGRIVAVGDRHQSIYGFRGADREAIPRMITELDATTLPLSITYRCPRLVVAEANEYVPALEAAPNAPEGIVREASEQELTRDAAEGDMVLSRANAPLVRQAFAWLAQGRRCRIQGRAIGEGLLAWIEAQKAGSVPQLVAATQAWLAAELERLEVAERDTQEAQDKAECVLALCEGAASVAAVLSRARSLFDDKGGGILLSSVHRAKGLEAARVWLLWDTFLRRDAQEERNLAYVAITRSKGELVYVTKEGEPQ